MPYYPAIKDYLSITDYYKTITPIHEKYSHEIPLKENVKEVLKDLDKDGSGEIEPEEFTKLIRNILTALVEN